MNIDIDLVVKIGVIFLVCIIVLLIVISIIKSKLNRTKEPLTSILDVDLNGVPSSSDMTFDYGYEKEDTVIMEPVEEKKETKSKKKTTAKKTPKKTETKKK